MNDRYTDPAPTAAAAPTESRVSPSYKNTADNPALAFVTRGPTGQLDAQRRRQLVVTEDTVLHTLIEERALLMSARRLGTLTREDATYLESIEKEIAANDRRVIARRRPVEDAVWEKLEELTNRAIGLHDELDRER